MQEAGGANYKCEVVLKLSRKTAVDVVAGRYDVVGFKRGSKPYKKFRDSGMIELQLADNIIQSEVVDVSVDVEQPRPEKEAKEAKKRKKATAHDGRDAVKEEDDDDELMALLDDVVSIVALGIDDYTYGIVSQVVSGTIDKLLMQQKHRQSGGVFMEGPLIDLRSLPWEPETKMRVSRVTEQAMCYSDAVQGEYNFISECTIVVAEVIDDLILATERLHELKADKLPRIERPMSSGVSISLVMETLLQAVENGGIALQSQAPRFRFEGPLIDLRSLPWETDALMNAATLPKIRSTASEEFSVDVTQVKSRQSETRDITLNCNEP